MGENEKVHRGQRFCRWGYKRRSVQCDGPGEIFIAAKLCTDIPDDVDLDGTWGDVRQNRYGEISLSDDIRYFVVERCHGISSSSECADAAFYARKFVWNSRGYDGGLCRFDVGISHWSTRYLHAL